ncbi:hypothetical protein HBI81_224450 [Parastagonospora nodorum]|nr:hypothetical protein HBH53_241200 [Parastagonospora nodorum]KAH3957037.1 hypothetical protein HBH51_230690 [Parastagonospora nodorum]KAH4012774.1 hypothetical protein HBI09_220450 [Parastagonospora nodorum]KAH4101116.1 hypothetical protein HBH46_144030 [Parastagonospora nodorum]KAH4118178.1 hypothetical protein HBH47_146400 [Parastagonospora nodorum]
MRVGAPIIVANVSKSVGEQKVDVPAAAAAAATATKSIVSLQRDCKESEQLTFTPAVVSMARGVSDHAAETPTTLARLPEPLEVPWLLMMSVRTYRLSPRPRLPRFRPPPQLTTVQSSLHSFPPSAYPNPFHPLGILAQTLDLSRDTVAR